MIIDLCCGYGRWMEDEIKEANKGDYVMKKRAWFYSNNKALARARIPPDVKQTLLDAAEIHTILSKNP